MAIAAGTSTLVSQLYVALFGRAPDEEGLQFWSALLAKGETPVRVAEMMYGTAAARPYFPIGLSNQDIVASFYLNVLGRTADAEGLAFWTAKLNAPGATPSTVIMQMIGIVADYSGTDPAGLVSQTLFNNRVTVGQHYGTTGGDIAGATDILKGVTVKASTVTAAITQINSEFTAAPVLISAKVNGAALVLTYDDASPLDAAHLPHFTFFGSTVDGQSRRVASVVADAVARTVTLSLESAVATGQVVKVRYADATTGNDSQAIQDASGNDAASLNFVDVLNVTVDSLAPVFQSAKVDGATLVMSYAESTSLSAANKPATSAFAVTVEGVARAVTSVAVDAQADTVTLTLASAVKGGQVVKVSYTDPSAANNPNAIQDTAGNDAASLAPTYAVNVAPDVTPPVLAGAIANGGIVVMTYADSGNLPGWNPMSLDLFKVTVNGAVRALNAVTVDSQAKTVMLALATPVTSGQTVTLTYTDPTSGDDINYVIQDLAGNDAAGLSAIAVVNKTPDAPGPVFLNAVVNGARVIMSYAAITTLDAINIPDRLYFTVKVDGVARPVKAVTVDPVAKTVNLELSDAVAFGQTVSLAYIDWSPGNDIHTIQDAGGVDAASLATVAVVNHTEYFPVNGNDGPQFAGASISGNRLLMSYTDSGHLSGVAPSPAVFVVKVDGAIRTVTSVVVNSLTKTVSLFLDGAVTSGQAVTVAYTVYHGWPPQGDVIEDTLGNAAASLPTTPVSYLSTFLIHDAGTYDAGGCAALGVDYLGSEWITGPFTFTNVASGTPLTLLDTSRLSEINYTLADAQGSNDHATLVLAQVEHFSALVRMPGVEHVRIEAGDGGDYANVNLVDAELQTLTLSGNHKIVVGGVARWVDASEHTGGVSVVSGSTEGALTIVGSPGADYFQTFVVVQTGSNWSPPGIQTHMYSTVDTISAGDGDDVIAAGKGNDILTGGAGADLFKFAHEQDSLNPNRTVFPTITDFSLAEGDSILLEAFQVGRYARAFKQILFPTEATFDQRLDAACADKTLDPDNFYFLNWFHYQGDTFMVFDNVRRVDGFHDGMDQIVKLTGLIDLNSGYTLTLDLLH